MVRRNVTAEDVATAQRLATELRDPGGEIVFSLQAFDAFAVVGLLQYAWRNPAIDAEQKALLEGFARALTDGIAERCPFAASVLEDGWNVALDVPRSGGRD